MPAQGLIIANDIKRVHTIVASLPTKYDIITTRHNPESRPDPWSACEFKRLKG
jgi:hypothetical protein